MTNPDDRDYQSLTGRLSGTDPNLQSVPIRTEEGQRMRQTFIDETDFEALLTADYSQIETRVAALLGVEAPRICPRCGATCWRDEADVGVDVIYGPWGCPCGWSESSEYDVTGGPKMQGRYRVDQWGGLTPVAESPVTK